MRVEKWATAAERGSTGVSRSVCVVGDCVEAEELVGMERCFGFFVDEKEEEGLNMFYENGQESLIVAKP